MVIFWVTKREKRGCGDNISQHPGLDTSETARGLCTSSEIIPSLPPFIMSWWVLFESEAKEKVRLTGSLRFLLFWIVHICFDGAFSFFSFVYFAYMHTYVHRVHAVPIKARRWRYIPQTWSYRWSQANMLVLELCPYPLQEWAGLLTTEPSPSPTCN